MQFQLWNRCQKIEFLVCSLVMYQGNKTKITIKARQYGLFSQMALHM